MSYPESIVSLVPSLTELLFDLELGDRIVGRTRFCIHPNEKVEDVPIVGGTKNPRLDKIFDIKPDLVIANREENRKEDVEELAGSLDVMVTDIKTIEDALLAIHDIGVRCGVAEKADLLIENIRAEMDNVPDEPKQSVAYFIWREPWMTVGRDTYIDSVLSHWNLKNVYGDQKRYPKTTLEDLKSKAPDLILLSSEPYPFKEKHREEIEAALPNSRVLMVDGEWFSWYGSRMLPAFKRLNEFRKAIS
jgi:ABC-type Fe3+-hydroxamate transport system substrate-binding protein